MRQSSLLSSPFLEPAPLDDDADFTAGAVAALGRFVRTWRRRMIRLFATLARRLAPWDAFVRALSSVGDVGRW